MTVQDMLGRRFEMTDTDDGYDPDFTIVAIDVAKDDCSVHVCKSAGLAASRQHLRFSTVRQALLAGVIVESAEPPFTLGRKTPR